MTDRDRRLTELLERLIELSPDERAAILDGECEDADLRREVEELLRHHDADEERPLLPDTITEIGPALSRSLSDTIVPDNLPEQIGPYHVKEQLGVGGMGAVYRVEHERLKKQFALKLLPAAATANPELVARFEREMEGTGQLDHEHVIRASDAGTSDGQHYLVMELVEGTDARLLSDQLGPMPVAAACEIVRQAALGLQHAHDRGLIHRDIKPSNLMISTAGCVKVVDFGLTTLRFSASSAQTHSSHLLGTIDYMSPEQLQDPRQITESTDIYSLGATLHKLLTGLAPFEGDHTMIQQMLMQAEKPAVSIEERRGDLPPALAEYVDRLLDRDPVRRPRSASDVAAALTEFCEGHQLTELVGGDLRTVPAATLIAPLSEVRRKRTRQRRGLILLAAVLLTAVGTLLLFPETPTLDPAHVPQQNTGSETAITTPQPRRRPVAADWQYLYCRAENLTPQNIQRLLEKLYQLSDELQLQANLDYFTLAYTNYNWNILQPTGAEIQISLNTIAEIDPGQLRGAVEKIGLPPNSTSIDTTSGGAEAFIERPAGTDKNQTGVLIQELHEFVVKRNAAPTSSYTLSERFFFSEDTGSTPYKQQRTEFIIPMSH